MKNYFSKQTTFTGVNKAEKLTENHTTPMVSEICTKLTWVYLMVDSQ
jgi:hypothetical protein